MNIEELPMLLAGLKERLILKYGSDGFPQVVYTSGFRRHCLGFYTGDTGEDSVVRFAGECFLEIMGRAEDWLARDIVAEVNATLGIE